MAGTTLTGSLTNRLHQRFRLTDTQPKIIKENEMKELTTFVERMEGKLNKKLRNDNLDAQFSENDHSDQAWMDYIP